MSDKDIRNRLADICGQAVLNPKTVTAYYFAEAQQFELPVVGVERGTMRRVRDSADTFTLTTEWRVVIYGQQAGLGLFRDAQDKLFDAYDAVFRAIASTKALSNATYPVISPVMDARIIGDSGVTTRELGGHTYLVWVINLEVETMQIAGDGYAC